MNNIAILTSGLSRGSNFEAVADFFKNRDDVEISFVLITRKKLRLSKNVKNSVFRIFLSQLKIMKYLKKICLKKSQKRILL